MTEKIMVSDFFDNEDPSQIEKSETEKTQEKESFLFKLKNANRKYRLTSILNFVWFLFVGVTIIAISINKFPAIPAVSSIVLFFALLPNLIFWNTSDIIKLSKKKLPKINSIELDDSLNVSYEFKENNDPNILTIDGPSSSVKVKNLKYASIYNKGRHYIDYNKQRCKVDLPDLIKRFFGSNGDFQ
jgi:hypothetical protein